MTRLIDVDALTTDILALPDCQNGYSGTYDKACIIGMIEEQPTVDAVPVIRCKDCKHSEPWYRDKRRCFLWAETGIDVWDDGYCNYAERKEE